MIRSRLQRKEKVRSGIERAPARQFPAHRAFVRRHVCACCGGSNQIECAHLRLETGGGISVKPHDAWTLPLEARHHFAQHVKGERSFWTEVGKDPWKICLQFALASPVPEVRDYARDVMIRIIDRHTEYDARISALAVRDTV